MEDANEFLGILEGKETPAEAVTAASPEGVLDPSVEHEGGDEQTAEKVDVKEFKELQKFAGRLTNEVGELRKELAKAKAAPAAPEKPSIDAELPDPPLREDFEDVAAYKAAQKSWVLETNKILRNQEAAAATQDQMRQAWVDSGMDDDEIEDVVSFWNDPKNTTPDKLRAAKEFLADPQAAARNMAERLQKLALRDGVPTSSGATGAAGFGGSSDVGAEEAASFNKAMSQPTVERQEAAIKAHEKRFKRFVPPTS